MTRALMLVCFFSLLLHAGPIRAEDELEKAFANPPDAVKPTGSRLEIDVVNLWPNRLIGDAALPPEKRFTVTNVQTYKKDSPLLSSGLLGPVTIQVSK